MTEQEMKKLSRAELLKVILMQSQELELLREETARQRQQIEDRNIAIQESGSLAEASMRLNRMFEDADAAVAQYKENTQRLCAEREASAQTALEQARDEADNIVAEAKGKAEALGREAEAAKEQTKREAESYWDEVSQKLDSFLNAHAGLRDMLAAGEKRQNG